MKYNVTGYIHGDVSQPYLAIAAASQNLLVKRFSAGRLKDLDVEISYCPILNDPNMPAIWSSEYRYEKRERVYYLDPELDYLAFKNGDEQARTQIFYEGLLQASTFLKTIGASDRQIREFEDVVTSASRHVR